MNYRFTKYKSLIFLWESILVTQALYEAITGYNPSEFQGPEHPVETVSWNEAKEFIQ